MPTELLTANGARINASSSVPVINQSITTKAKFFHIKLSYPCFSCFVETLLPILGGFFDSHYPLLLFILHNLFRNLVKPSEMLSLLALPLPHLGITVYIISLNTIRKPSCR